MSHHLDSSGYLLAAMTGRKTCKQRRDVEWLTTKHGKSANTSATY